MPLVCKFFQQGHCKKGADCDFEHTRPTGGPGGMGNPFATTDSTKSNSPNNSRRKSGRNVKKQQPQQQAHSQTSLHVTKPGAQVHSSQDNKKGNKGKGKGPRNINDQQQQQQQKKGKGKGTFKKLSSTQPSTQSLPSAPTIQQHQQLQQSRQQQQTPQIPGVKDYVDMVMADLSHRPFCWHFSSFGLSLSPTHSLPFPFLGTTELSAEELRLQVYAEAAATGGRIENYCKVVGEIKERAEVTTKLLIPNLEPVISDLLKANHVNTREDNGNTSANPVHLQQHQQSLKQALLQQRQSTMYTVNDHQHPPYNPQPQLPPQQQYPDTIIPDDSFAFGFIPEIPPE